MDTTKHVTASPASSGLTAVDTTNHPDTLTNFFMQTGRKIICQMLELIMHGGVASR